MYGTTQAGKVAVSSTQVAGGTTGSVLFVASDGTMGQDNTNFFWDATNHRLGVGTTGPTSKAHIVNAVGSAQSTLLIEQDNPLADIFYVRRGANQYDFAVNSVGYVGIGTAGPNFVLHTSGAAVALGAPAAAPTDANLNASNISFYLDEAGNNLKVRVKYSNGTTLKTATVALV